MRDRVLFVSSFPLLLAIACEGPPPVVQETIPPKAVTGRPVAAFNLSRGVALHGYDPVSYWPEGGALPRKGDERRAVDYGGAIYLFADDDNLATFRQDPAKYEPAHGGWCSWAMKDQSRVDVDPETYLLRDGRLFLFYNAGGTDTRAMWLEREHAPQVRQADAAWARFDG